jgi:hypothetical protein
VSDDWAAQALRDATALGILRQVTSLIGGCRIIIGIDTYCIEVPTAEGTFKIVSEHKKLDNAVAEAIAAHGRGEW